MSAAHLLSDAFLLPFRRLPPPPPTCPFLSSTRSAPSLRHPAQVVKFYACDAAPYQSAFFSLTQHRSIAINLDEFGRWHQCRESEKQESGKRVQD